MFHPVIGHWCSTADGFFRCLVSPIAYGLLFQSTLKIHQCLRH
ncbi:hypothetical protein SynA1825c_01236 [Synechococcus sp. A18-25c]|nr:hypothetical protein SynA1560_01247 [Synechococcus sp. A15-60]QNJ19543.1 hypothetical protein SynA1825c_01236 [Synechococcus sp. A18-25c]